MARAIEYGVPSAYEVTDVKTAAYTARWGECVRCDPTGGGFTVTAPSAAKSKGRTFIVKNSSGSTNTITIDGNGSETIDGAANVTITTARGAARIISNGTNLETI